MRPFDPNEPEAYDTVIRRYFSGSWMDFEQAAAHHPHTQVLFERLHDAPRVYATIQEVVADAERSVAAPPAALSDSLSRSAAPEPS